MGTDRENWLGPEYLALRAHSACIDGRYRVLVARAETAPSPTSTFCSRLSRTASIAAKLRSLLTAQSPQIHRSTLRSNTARIRDITGLPLSPRRGAYKRNQTPTGWSLDPQDPHASHSCALSGRSAMRDAACRIRSIRRSGGLPVQLGRSKGG